MKRAFLAAALSCAALPAISQSVVDVLDLDSFNRDVKFLGAVDVEFSYLKNDCQYEWERGLNCTVLRPQPQVTEFEDRELASITLPPRAAHSMLCWDLTALDTVVFENTTASNQANAAFSARTIFTVRSPVLDDPSVINPVTGRHYGGEISFNMIPYSEGMSLAPGERNSKSFHATRRCGSVAITKDALINSYGLTRSQANRFFNSEITVVLGTGMFARVITSASYQYNFRLYGDRR